MTTTESQIAKLIQLKINPFIFNGLHFIILFALFALLGCSKPLFYEEEAYVFGTRVEVSIAEVEEVRARQATAAVMHEFQRLHDQLHAWKASELSALNTAISQGQPKIVSVELATLLQQSAQFSAQSGGLFNPSIGGLIQTWGFQADEFKAILPDEQKILALLKANPKMGELSFRNTNNPAGVEIRSANRALQFDLGGYAKGYALDRAAAILRQQGIQNALINIGGNVLALGQHGSRPWRVGIQHPRKPGPIATLTLHDGEAIGTSGDYQRFFELNGKRYCHLIDPRNGYPAQGVQAVTILTHGAQAGLLSDVLSKPLFISGKNNWRAMAQQINLQEALLIDADGIVHVSVAMQKRLEFTDASSVIKVEP
jgi:thiamine biosynthesis lipoprotein